MESRGKLQTYLPYEVMTMVCGYMAPEDLKELLFLDQYFCQTVVGDKRGLWESKFSIHFPLAYQKLQNQKELDWKKEFWKQHDIECSDIKKSLKAKLFLWDKEETKQLVINVKNLFSYAKEGHYSKFKELLTAMRIQDIGFLEILLELKNTSNESLLHCIQENDLSNLMLNHIYALAKTIESKQSKFFRWAILCKQPADVFEKLLNHGIKVTVSEIILAAEKGCTALIEVFYSHLQRGVEIVQGATPSLSSNSLLIFAASYGQVDIIKLILKRDGAVDINFGSIYGYTPLHAAAAAGRLAVLQLLVDNNANVHAISDDHRTALHYGIKHPSVIKFLLDEKVNINAIDQHRMTVLHAAVGESKSNTEYLETIQTVLNHSDKKNKIDIEAKDIFGETALHIACELGNCAIVSLLLEKGANVNATNQTNETPLDLAIFPNQRVKFIIEHRLAIIDLLLKKDVAVSDVLFNKILEKGNKEIIKRLLPAVTNIAFADAKHNNLLHLAVQFNCSINVIRALINKGCDINAVNNEGKTPFALADQKGYEAASVLFLITQLSREPKKDLGSESDEEAINGNESGYESEYESEDELFTLDDIEARLKKLKPSDLENIEIPKISDLDEVRELYNGKNADVNAKEELNKKEPEVYEIIMPQVNFDHEIVIEPINMQRIVDEMSDINLELDTIEEPANELSLELQLENLPEELPENLPENLLENEILIIPEDQTPEFSEAITFSPITSEDSKNAIAQDAAEKLLTLVKMCFRDKKNQDFFIDRVKYLSQHTNQDQTLESICEKAYEETAKYLIYQTANDAMLDRRQQTFMAFAKELSSQYIASKEVKNPFEDAVLERAKLQTRVWRSRLKNMLKEEKKTMPIAFRSQFEDIAKMNIFKLADWEKNEVEWKDKIESAKKLVMEKAQLVRSLQNEYLRIKGDMGKFMNDNVKTQNKLNVIQRSINRLKSGVNEEGSINTFVALRKLKISLLNNPDFTQSRNRFFTIESDAKKTFEEKFGKLSPRKK